MVHRKVQYKRIPRMYILSALSIFKAYSKITWNPGDELSNLEATFIHNVHTMVPPKISRILSNLPFTFKFKTPNSNHTNPQHT